MMAEFCVHERHGGICEKTGTYCNLGACPYEDLQKFAPVRNGKWIGKPISGFADVRCSVCMETFSENRGRWKFCPNCGERMLEDE